MLRTALRPASLGLLALALALATAFAALGNWQLERSRTHAGPGRTEQVVPLAQVLAPSSTFTGRADGQRVAVTGTYRPQDQVLVADRPRGGEPGSWLVAALAVEADGGAALLPVLRGWLPEGAAPPDPPSGAVELTGRLQPGEPPRGYAPGQELRALSSADLVNAWDGPLYTGYLALEEASAPLSVVPTSAPTGDLDLRNVSYALQWWLFAAFAVLVWVHLVRQRHRDELEDGEGDPAWEDEGMSAETTDPMPQEARP